MWPSDLEVSSPKNVQLRCLTKYVDTPFETESIRNPRVNTSLLAVTFDQVLLGRDVVLGTATRCGLDGLSGEYQSRTKFEARRLPSVGDFKFKSKSLQYGQPCAWNTLWRGRGSSVGIATRYELDGKGIKSRWGQDFPHQSRPALGPTQPPIQWVSDLSQG